MTRATGERSLSCMHPDRHQNTPALQRNSDLLVRIWWQTVAVSTRRVYFQVEQEVYERAVEAAEADRRSLSNWLAVTIERVVGDQAGDSAQRPAP